MCCILLLATGVYDAPLGGALVCLNVMLAFYAVVS